MNDLFGNQPVKKERVKFGLLEKMENTGEKKVTYKLRSFIKKKHDTKSTD